MSKRNKDMLIWFVEWMTIILVCSNFLQEHFSSDTYVLHQLGYFTYPSKYFLRDGRIISAIFCYLGGILKLPIPVYTIAMDFLGMIFLSIAIFISAKVFIDIIKPNSLKKEILIHIASFVLILNQYTLEYLLFPESAVMCLGILFIVLSMKAYTGTSKYKYLKIFLCIMGSGLAYQGEMNIFPVLILLIIVLKQAQENKRPREYIVQTIKEIIKIGIIAVIALTLCTILVKICESQYGQVKHSFIIINNLRILRRTLNRVLYCTNEILVNCISMFPKYSIFVCIISTTIILLIINRKNILNIVNYLILSGFAILSTVIPLAFINVGICSRTSETIMMIFGISLLVLIASIRENDKKYKKEIVYIITTFIFILNSFYIIRNTTEHISANKIEHQEGAQIKNIVEKYEKETGIKVEKFAYMYDSNPQQFAKGIKPMQSMTERKLACSWSILYAMDYYCNREFKLTLFDLFEKIDIYQKPLEHIKYQELTQKDYTEFSEEQIIIKDDTLYMIVY